MGFRYGKLDLFSLFNVHMGKTYHRYVDCDCQCLFIWCDNMKQIKSDSTEKLLGFLVFSMKACTLQMQDRLLGITILISLPKFGSRTVVSWLCNWVFLLPTADVRLEEFVYEKLEKKAPTRMNNHELLGQSMIESGNEFGPGTAYGKRYSRLPDKLTSDEHLTPAEFWSTLVAAPSSFICVYYD